LQDDNSINDLINTSIASTNVISKAWLDIEETYTPIDITYARDILNDIINHEFPKGSCGWIYILCNDDLSSKDQTFFLSTYIEKKCFNRGFANYHGVLHGKEKSAENLKKSINYSLHTGNKDIRVESIFQLSPYISIKFINNVDENNCSLNHINEHSDVILKQKVEIGKTHVLLEHLWSQIQLLNAIKTDILLQKNNSFDGTINEPTYSYGSLSFEKLQEKVNHILSDVVTISDTTEDKADTRLEAVIKRVYNRPLTEITEQLWDLLRFTGSYTDLKRIFTFVFQISSRSSIVNIPMNNSRMAELIRELSQQRLAIPHLASTEPLELLLEIGMEKVMKDYEYIFSESKICMLSDINIGGGQSSAKIESNRSSVRKSIATISDLNQNARKTLLHRNGKNDSNDDFDTIKNSRFNECEVEKVISTLTQIHIAIEHLLMMQNNLNIENDYSLMVKKMLEMPLKLFDVLQAQKYDKFQFQLSDKKVLYLVENLNPNIQKVTVQSENKFQAAKTIFYFNIEQIVPFLIYKENEGEAIDKKGNVYHFTSYSNITSKF
jgi:protein zwilch